MPGSAPLKRTSARHLRSWMVLALVTLSAAALPQAASAQRAVGTRSDDTPVRDNWGYFGIHLGGARPLGEFGELVDAGFLFEFDGRIKLAADGALALRFGAGAVIYGNEVSRVCFPPPVGCRIGVDVTTTNSVASLYIGPELTGTGSFAPYAYTGIGLGYFATTSSLSGANDPGNQQLFNTRNYDDVVRQIRAGGGLRFDVAETSGGPVQIDIGIDYHGNGVAEYLRRGDIVDLEDGEIEIFPNRTEANLLVFRAGVSFGVGGGRDDG